MINSIKRILIPPGEFTKEKKHTVIILNVILLACLAVLIFRAVSFTFLEHIGRIDLYAVPVLIGVLILFFYFVRKGYINTVSFLLICGLWIRATIRFCGFDVIGLMNIGIAGYYLVLIAAGLLLGRKFLVTITIITFLTLVSIYIAGMNGLILPENNPVNSFELLLAYSVNLPVLAFFLNEYERRKVYEADLLRSKQMFQLVLDNIPQYVFWKDLNSIYLGCNKNFAKIAGVEKTESIIGKTDYDLVWPGEVSDHAVELDKKVISENKPRLNKIESFYSIDGRETWLNTNKIPLHDTEGNVVGILCMNEDITERIESEERLKENEEKYRSLVENINVGIYRTAFESGAKIIHANTEFAKMLGYDSADELMGVQVEDTYETPEKREEILSLLKEYGFFRNVEIRLKRKDGLVIWTEISGSVYREEETAKWIDGIVIDVTRRKLTEIALRETEEKLTTVAQNVPVILWSINKEGKILLSEGRGLEGIKLSPGENVGKSVFEIYKDIPELISGIKAVLKGEQVNMLVNIRDAYFEAWASPLKDSEGNIRGATGILLDITRRRAIEDALVKSEQNYKNLFEKANDAIMIIEPENEYILEANHKALELYGFKMEEFIGKSLKDISKFVQKGNERIQRLINGEELRNFETVYFDKEGEEIEVLVNASLIDYEDKAAILSIHHDITEHNRLREQLNRAQKMESLGRLAGAVAHDLNHILTGLVTYPDLLLLDMEKEDSFRPKIESIKKSGQRAAEIVQDLLTMARGGIINTDTLNLNDIVAEFLGSTEIKQIKTGNQHIKIDTGVEPFLKNITCSKIQMLKVLYNIFTNALEAMPGGGRIYISTSNREVKIPIKGYDDIPQGDYVVLSVSDTGGGISADDLPYIFEPYFTKKVLGRSGSGIGLSVVWNVIKSLNGFIDVRSETDMGTVFDFYIPATFEKRIESDEIEDIREYYGNGETILIIDDEPVQRDIGEQLLFKLKYTPVKIESGEEAVEYLQNNRADLLLIDMLLGAGMDGLDTFKKILESNPQQKAIIVSGFSGSDKIKKAQEMGAKGFIRKPFTIKEIGLIIKEELGD
ncbi:PAS domain S-box protein [candidate division KSB1 bacterium]